MANWMIVSELISGLSVDAAGWGTVGLFLLQATANKNVKTLEAMLTELAEEVQDELLNRIKTNDEYSQIFTSVFKKVMLETNDKKMIHWRNLILNSILKEEIPISKVENTIAVLDYLTQFDLMVLQYVYNFQIGLIDPPPHEKELEANRELLTSSMSRLSSHGLIGLNNMSVMFASEGNMLGTDLTLSISHLKNYLVTAFGDLFCNLLTEKIFKA
jgi:hypothetical protein